MWAQNHVASPPPCRPSQVLEAVLGTGSQYPGLENGQPLWFLELNWTALSVSLALLREELPVSSPPGSSLIPCCLAGSQSPRYTWDTRHYLPWGK